MNNPVTYALGYLRREIPLEILKQTYLSNLTFRITTAESLDDRIRLEVIGPVVLADTSLIGGVEDSIELRAEWREIISPRSAVYRIPLSATNGRRITSAISTTFTVAHAGGYTPYFDQQNLVVGNAAGVWASHTPIPITGTSRCVLIAENTVLIEDLAAIPNYMFLNCWLENDESYSNLKRPSWKYFAHLTMLAVKSDIYTKNIIRMGEGVLEGGGELGIYRSLIEGYADANQEYNEYFEETWQQVTRFNDKNAHTKHLRYALGGRH